MRERWEGRLIFQLLILSPNGKGRARPKPEAWNFIHIGDRGLRTWTSSTAFPGVLAEELDWKWNGWGLSQCSYGLLELETVALLLVP